MKNQREKKQVKENQSLISSSTLPSSIDDIEAEYKLEIAAIMAEETKAAETATTGKKRGRKKAGEKAPSAENVQSVSTDEEISINAEDVQEWIALPFDIVLSRLNKKPLSDIEQIALARSTAKVLNKYIPTISGKYAAEIGLCICVASIVGARVKPEDLQKEIKIEPKEPLLFRNQATEAEHGT
jgi:hypothetical protein